MILKKKQHPSSMARRGLASVTALIALIVIGLICASLLKVALARRSELQLEERRLQTISLLESGLDRASARLQFSPDYSGEAWQISPEDLGGRGSASVAIQVERIPDQADRRKVRVQADFPTGSTLRSRQSRERIMNVKLSSGEPR